jgi:hypothetical protein
MIDISSEALVKLVEGNMHCAVRSGLSSLLGDVLASLAIHWPWTLLSQTDLGNDHIRLSRPEDIVECSNLSVLVL